MKALILAAGLGTRLRPHTLCTPKPLFPIFGQPNLDTIIHRLEKIGCKAIVINAHHLHEKIEDFIAKRQYPIPVRISYEPVILGTGGAIKSLSSFWDDAPFFVINGDVVTDTDLAAVYQFHLGHHHPATLVFCDAPEFNTVNVSLDDTNVISFDRTHHGPIESNSIKLTFTGIQVLDPLVLEYIPDNQFYSSIDAFKKMMANGHHIAAYTPKTLYWKDIGTPKRYMEAVCDKMAPLAFEKAFGGRPANDIQRIPLKGDGSDRKWYRLQTDSDFLVMVDHGICRSEGATEFSAFVNIGNHLYQKGIPVPAIFLHDDFSGLVFLEDLGNLHLQDVIHKNDRNKHIRFLYESIIEGVIEMSINGYSGFDLDWTYQTQEYDVSLIMEKECRYFVEAFLNGYLNMSIRFENFAQEFELIAEEAIQNAISGFMHRDMQSRNIMIKDNQFRFIDFQGGRIGPFQYDLASLLIDPYAELAPDLQQHLLKYAFEKILRHKLIERRTFYNGYTYCAICRNFQILGAFGFLTCKKNKPWFEQYIPSALKTLKQNLSGIQNKKLNRLTSLVEKIPSLC